MRSKFIVITGASDGIGAAAARQLRIDGHQLFLVGRSPDKTASVAERLGVPYAVADFARLDQVHSLADELLERCPVIDVLANNAGLMAPTHRTMTDDGHEITNQVNYLAPFLLDHLLRDRLVESHATVIGTASMAHWGGNLKLDDLDTNRSYNAMQVYGTSKIALMLHTRELQRREGANGINAVSFHPGVVATNFSNGSGSLMQVVYGTPARVFLPKRPAQGADTLVYLAEGTPVVDFPPGHYMVNRRPATTRPCIDDVQLADALWRRTEQVLDVD